VPPGDAPPRATVQARLARPEWKIEIVVTAAI
jgi:enamine deaminase RidA (YjgF/YER057c/UK114 family)